MAPIVAGTAARQYGWRWGMFAPGAIGLFVGVLVLFLCKDSPESIGYKPIESIEKAKKVGPRSCVTPCRFSICLCCRHGHLIGST